MTGLETLTGWESIPVVSLGWSYSKIVLKFHFHVLICVQFFFVFCSTEGIDGIRNASTSTSNSTIHYIS